MRTIKFNSLLLAFSLLGLIAVGFGWFYVAKSRENKMAPHKIENILNSNGRYRSDFFDGLDFESAFQLVRKYRGQPDIFGEPPPPYPRLLVAYAGNWETHELVRFSSPTVSLNEVVQALSELKDVRMVQKKEYILFTSGRVLDERISLSISESGKAVADKLRDIPFKGAFDSAEFRYVRDYFENKLHGTGIELNVSADIRTVPAFTMAGDLTNLLTAIEVFCLVNSLNARCDESQIVLTPQA